jgi:hypothetical protein
MKMVFANKSKILWFLLAFSFFSGCESAWAKLVIHSQTAVEIELTGYNSLDKSSIFKGILAAGSKHEINTPYRGFALLVFAGGQRYPVIIGDKSFTLEITDPGEPPSFADSGENDFFYKLLSGGEPPPGQYDFALLMIQAKHLLESSHSIKTVKELTTKKKEFHEFVRMHYESLKHSDMIKRLIAQYFMMHEYVDYQIEGVPANDIKATYQKEVLAGVADWLNVLSPHISEQAILNYCVSLYYNRSMVTLASLIIDNFKDAAYCPGDASAPPAFPADLQIIEPGENITKKLGTLKGNKLIAFVSDDCPVSMVETIIQARQSANRKEKIAVIVAPLQKLSSKHLAMSRMIRNGDMFFINDEKWRKENLAKEVRLPLFIRVEDNSE